MNHANSFKLMLLLVTLFFSCKNSELIHQIEKEYKKSIDPAVSDLTIQELELLTIEKNSFEDLSKSEIQLIDRENFLIEKQIKSIDSIEFLLKSALTELKDNDVSSYTFSNSNSYQTVEVDSIKTQINFYEKQSVKLKIEKLENDIKIKKLLELIKTGKGASSQNLKVKHKVKYQNHGISFTDTLYFLSFNDGKYKYLNRNLTYVK